MRCLDLGQDFQILGERKDYRRHALTIKIVKCENSSDCYTEEVRNDQLKNITFGAAWSTQFFQQKEYDADKIIEKQLDFIFPGSFNTLIQRPKIDLMLHRNEVVLHDNEIYNFYAQEVKKTFMSINYVKSILSVDDPSLFTMTFQQSKDEITTDRSNYTLLQFIGDIGSL